jgi:hypothetical protein
MCLHKKKNNNNNNKAKLRPSLDHAPKNRPYAVFGSSSNHWTSYVLKPNTFANFEVPAKIAHRNFFFGRLKGYFGFFLPFSGIV